MLDGQHKFTAALCIKHRLETANRSVPGWCKKFRCRIIRQDLDLNTLQKIAGKEQAKSLTVAAMSFTQTLEWYKKEMDAIVSEAKRRGEQPVLNRAELLRTTYDKTGKTPKFDGSVVCFFLPALAVLGCWMGYTQD